VPETENIPVKQLLNATSPISVADVESLERAVATAQVTEVRQEARELHSQADSLSDDGLARGGIAAYLLGRHKDANELLSRVSGNAVASYYHGHALCSLDNHLAAAERFEAAANEGFDRVQATLLRAGAIRCSGDIDEAERVLKSIAVEAASRAEYSFQVGCIWADRGDALSAIEYFERAVDMDPHHSRALFWLAAENCLRGNDAEAIRLYEQSLSKPPHYLGALLNLGLLYEDDENYTAAAFCFNRVIEFDPNNERARLYLRDIEATHEMYYDEDSARNQARIEQLLSRPVTDFELSVRSRNCLAGMNINSLGDLTEVSEQELLAGKNFGETSLHEIRDLLQSHGLRIGQNQHMVQPREPAFEANLSPEEQAIMNKPVTDLNVSVRARKCMVRLGINSLGQLLQRTPDELLSSRNFGVTSLNEIRARLGDIGLKLRND
jgi:DNA-directed RNA polymerase subunit alpha